MDYITWFLNVEQVLQNWDKSYLVMGFSIYLFLYINQFI